MAALSGLLALFLVFTSQGILLNAAQISKDGDKTDFSFEDILNRNFTYNTYSGRWHNDSLLYQDPDMHLVLEDPGSGGVKEVLLDGNISTEHGAFSHILSADGKYILLINDYKKQWRHSFLGKYLIFDREKNGTDEAIIHFPNGELQNSSVMYVAWSPTGHQLVFVHDNDLYYQSSPLSSAERVTNTGEEFVYNGVPDWLYEEDVIGSRKAIYWAPDSNHLVFATFNDTQVPLIEFPMYGPSCDVYGSTRKIPYPKAGDSTKDGKAGVNPTVALHLYDVTSKSTRDITPPSELANEDHYYLGVDWASADKVMITWSNRVQNHSIFSLCDANNGHCQKVREDKYPGGWIRVPVLPLWFIDDGDRYVTEASKDEGSSGKWRQVAVMSTNGEEGPVFLTQGQSEVLGVLAVDKDKKVVYYTSTNGDPKEAHIFRVGLPGADAVSPRLSEATCLSCDDEACVYNGASFSHSANYYIRRCRGPGVPSDYLVGLEDNKVTLLKNNTNLSAAMAGKNLPQREYHLIDVGGGYKAQAEIYLPPGFSEDKKYPLLISTYGGPGSQEVVDNFPLGGSISRWLAHLGSEHQVAVASVDGRGAGSRGDKYMYELYRRMGTVEVEDQAAAAKYFKSLPYIDDSKPVAIYGWSYGGEVSSHGLADYVVFGCAIAVAPVTSKRYYDTAYTERVMGLDIPTDNAAGYNDTDIVAKAAKFKGKEYLLAHGTADDNVHFMNTAQLVKALVHEGVQFKFGMYVDEDHGIRGQEESLRHLLRSMTDFLTEDCWHLSRDDNNKSSANHNGCNISLLVLFVCMSVLSVLR